MKLYGYYHDQIEGKKYIIPDKFEKIFFEDKKILITSANSPYRFKLKKNNTLTSSEYEILMKEFLDFWKGLTQVENVVHDLDFDKNEEIYIATIFDPFAIAVEKLNDRDAVLNKVTNSSVFANELNRFYECFRNTLQEETLKISYDIDYWNLKFEIEISDTDKIKKISRRKRSVISVICSYLAINLSDFKIVNNKIHITVNVDDIIKKVLTTI